VKNLEKVFYMLSGIALVFIGIVIGQFLDSDAVAQKLGKPLEDERTDYGVVQTTIFPLLIGLTQLNNQEYSEALEDKLQQHVE